MLLTTFGISLILIQATRTLFGAQNVQVANPSWMSGGGAVMQNLIRPYNPRVLARRRGDCLERADEDAPRPIRARGDAEPPHGRVRRRENRTCRFVCVRVRCGHCGALRLCAVADRQCRSGSRAELHHRFVHSGRARQCRPVSGHGNRRLRGLVSKAVEPFWSAVLAKIAVLVLIVLFIQKQPQGMFALKGRSAEA